MKDLKNQAGAIVIMLAVLLSIFLGLMGLGIEVGKWYLVKAEMSKAIDAAALMGIKNISNPYVDLDQLMQETAKENFPDGYLGSKSLSVQSEVDLENKVITVTAEAKVNSIFAKLFGIETIQISNMARGRRDRVEIMLVLDRSGSMSGALDDLKDAAKNFLDFFEDTQDEDKAGLITYATGVKVDFPLGYNFVDSMKDAIDNMSIPPKGDRDTNMEDALDQADDDTDRNGNPTITFTDQAGVPEDERIQQFLLFFSDGRATSFRADFTRNGDKYNVVIPDPYDVDWAEGYLHDPYTGKSIGIKFMPTGDGKKSGESTCGGKTTRWWIFEDYPIEGYDYPYCNIPEYKLKSYVYATAKQMAIKHAQELKDKGIKIYTIGLGSVDKELLAAISSGPEFQYYTPTSDDLKAIFNAIAKEIKLRLVR